jgi:hypothetical protein
MGVGPSGLVVDADSGAEESSVKSLGIVQDTCDNGLLCFVPRLELPKPCERGFIEAELAAIEPSEKRQNVPSPISANQVRGIKVNMGFARRIVVKDHNC